MELIVSGNAHVRWTGTLYTQIWKIMRLTTLLIFIATLHVSARTDAQKVSIESRKISLRQALGIIQQQTGYSFIVEKNILDKVDNLQVHLHNATIREALNACLYGRPYGYTIDGKIITLLDHSAGEPVTARDDHEAILSDILIRGHVTDSTGAPLAGATVKVRGTNNGALTDKGGNFNLSVPDGNAVIEVSFVGYATASITVGNERFFTVRMTAVATYLDESIVQAYGTTSRRYNTGNISKVTAKEIEEQPVMNPLAALEGRVPGLVITQSSGVSGSSFNVQIRGQSSLTQGSQPLFVIDGIPYTPQNDDINRLSSALDYNVGPISSGLSPFYSINPNDIESIEILKDADATSIYGSRGANGVVLITTKKGKIGKTEITANVYSGISKVGRTVPLLNTKQYVSMRTEAFKNDGITPDISSAPDLVAWDTTKYTDFKKLLIGNTGHNTNAQLSISGGNENTRFLISSAYGKETNVFPGSLGAYRASSNFNLSHVSSNKKLKVDFTANYSSSVNISPVQDLTSWAILTNPNLPSLYDSLGNLKWDDNGGYYNYNPLSFLKDKYKAVTDNLFTSVNISYNIFQNLSAKILAGYNNTIVNEKALYPASAQPTWDVMVSRSQFGTNNIKGWNIEPQLEYQSLIGKGKLDILAGGTMNNKNGYGTYLSLTGFSTEDLMENYAAATTVETNTNSSYQYKYVALFGRINYNWLGKYILNLNGRRDGSSRFGPDKRFANFGSIGSAWIFSQEQFFKNVIPLFSFGKLRASYGVSGNDQIGNYKFLDAWTVNSIKYQGEATLSPSNLYNPDFTWERNRKLEIAMDLGFFEDRTFLSISWFRNRSNNQLINYTLPTQTGFSSILKNFPALVQNKGWEILLNGDVIKSAHFVWNSALNVTIPSNKLLEFNDLQNSSYKNMYRIGKSLNSIIGYQSKGVDPETGVYKYTDVNNDGLISNLDYQYLGNKDPKFYGGWKNTFSYNGVSLDFLFDFRKQTGYNYFYWTYNGFYVPGTFQNQSVYVEDRWQKAGDNTIIGKYTTSRSSDMVNLYNSNLSYSDASFIKLRNISLSYSLSQSALRKMHFKSFKIYGMAQNLLTITSYKGADPETQGFYVLPPLKTFVMGIQLTL